MNQEQDKASGKGVDIESLTQEQASESNAIEIPSVSLPKGGGAIRGIDETFKVNASNGTGGGSIALPITPSRNDFSPALDLRYSSGSGNSSVGLGWQFNLASITRKTDKGLPRYQDGDEVDNDIYLFSESEDLVVYSEEVTAGNWQPVSFTHGDYQITRYRPRVEGGFARIEKITHATHLTYWKVTSRENIVTIFGRSAEARIADPSAPERIYQWLPEFSYDNQGNWIKYEYKSEDKVNIPLLPHEINRINGNAVFSNQYIKRICYGNRIAWYADEALPYDPQATVDDEHLFELVFDYGEHDVAVPVPGEDTGLSWLYRDDAFSSYRSGFEIRTSRLCQRILMFHHFSDEVEFGVDYLVRSLRLNYEASSINQSGIAEVNYLASAIHSGHIRKDDNTYATKSLPAIEFTYQKLNWSHEIKVVEEESLVNAPTGLQGRYQWIDLYGEGISGILTETETALYYKNNLSDINKPGSVEFTNARAVIVKPSLVGLSSGVLSIRDLASSSEKQIVVESAELNGYYQLTRDNKWQPFKAYESLANIDFSQADLRRFDVTGDGQAELVISEEQAFVWYKADGKKGYQAAQKTSRVFDEELGPVQMFSDSSQSIYLADMSGDGLTDIVRIRNAEVCYWPNLGYGKFGAKVNMGNAPRFDFPDMFNPQYLQLTDVSGTGVTDILYLGGDNFKAYLNHAGNGWSEPHSIDTFFPMDQNAKISVVDLLGSGTSCIVWSSDLPAYSNTPMRYIDLMGSKKPHVLIRSKNNLGQQTTIEYRSSTYYYLKDKLDDNPWITKLPFPVHVVSNIVTEDKITKVSFRRSYNYRHGYYDSHEREFRGFGLVEQTDSEFYEQWKSDNSGNNLELSEAFYQPPMLTRTWYHTGAFIDNERILNQFKDEYWFNKYNRLFPDDPLAMIEPALPDAVVSSLDSIAQFDLLENLSADEWREAVRACKGMVLRQEVFALDAPQVGATEAQLKLQALPYSVSASSCHIRIVQPRLQNLSNVFLLTGSQNLELQYERTPEDVRISHNITLKTDDHNNVLEEASIVYARNTAKAQSMFQNLSDRVSDFSDFDEQVKLQNAFNANIADAETAQTTSHITFTQNIYTNDVESNMQYRLAMVAENKNYQITGLVAAAELFSVQEFNDVLNNAVSSEIDYGDSATAGIERRLIEHYKTLYYRDDLTGPLGLGQLAANGLSFENYQLAFTPALRNSLFGGKLTAPFAPLTDAKYIELDGDDHWWVRSGTFHYIDTGVGETADDARVRFYAPNSYTDAFGTQTVVQYKVGYNALLMEVVTDALGNRTSVETFNYRTLAPNIMRDINDNLSQVLVDELGMVVASAYLGKDLDGDGIAELDLADDLSGISEISETDEVAVASFLQLIDSNDIVSAGKALLKNASRRFIYDLNAYLVSEQPTVVVSIQREHHTSVLPDSPLQFRYEYSDGGGNLAMSKAQAEPGEAKQVTVNPDDSFSVNVVDTRVLLPTQWRWIGTGRTLLNNKGKAVRKYEPYFSVTPGFEDIKELVEVGVSPSLYYDPVGRLIKTEMPDQTFSKVEFDSWYEQQFDQNDTVMDSQWYQDRISRSIDAGLLALGKNPDFEEVAAQRAAEHHNTPNAIYLDSLGRPVMSLTHNARDAADKEMLYLTFVELDIEGNALSVRDARGNTVMQYGYDMLGHRVYQKSMDSGERWILNNVVSKPHITWDGKSQIFTFKYDAIQRPVEAKVSGGEDPLNLLDHVYEKLSYGEGQPNDKEFNLRGKQVSRYDTAGKLSFKRYDSMGDLLSSDRQVTVDYRNMVDWQGGGLDAKLEPALHTTSHSYDALGRSVSSTSPDLSITEYGYTEANRLGTVHVTQTGIVRTEYVESIRYDEQGRRKSIRYRSGIVTNYQYDPETFRVIHLDTRKGNSEILQDVYYTYDPMGNITHKEDKSQPVIFFNNQKTASVSSYTYDARYQLIETTGREHAGQQIDFAANDNTYDEQFQTTHAPGDVMAWRNYTQQFYYDPVGNILQHKHLAASRNWTRIYDYEIGNNRLTSTTVGGSTHNYNYHASHGYIDSMPHLQVMRSNFKDQLQVVAKQGILSGTPETTYYMYDSGGQRIRKVTDNAAAEGEEPTKKSERLYLGGNELYTQHSGTNAGLQRVSLHVMDDTRRIAMIDTRKNVDDGTDVHIVRFQFSDHLESCCIETDDSGEVISYELYHAFGTTAYLALNSIITVARKRYKYTGKERDEESGLEYHGSRYYLTWLGRWMSADPTGIADGVNLYVYVSNNPVRLIDPSGSDGWDVTFGVLKVIGGGIEVVAGGTLVAAGVATGWTGVGIVAAAGGGVVTLHGVDTIQSGIRSIFSEDPVDSFTSQGLQAAGMSRGSANLTDAAISVVGTLGSGAATRLPSLAAASRVPAGQSLVHLTTAESATAINSTQTLGRGGSTLYAATPSLAEASAPVVALRTGLLPAQATTAVTIPAQATAAFRTPAVIGPITAWQRASGAFYSAGTGSVNLTTGVFTRTGPAVNQLAFYALDTSVVVATQVTPALTVTSTPDVSGGVSSVQDVEVVSTGTSDVYSSSADYSTSELSSAANESTYEEELVCMPEYDEEAQMCLSR